MPDPLIPGQDEGPDFSNYFETPHVQPQVTKTPISSSTRFSSKMFAKKKLFFACCFFILVGVLFFQVYRRNQVLHPKVPDGYRMTSPALGPPRIEKVR
jgi:hypothetical protein